MMLFSYFKTAFLPLFLLATVAAQCPDKWVCMPVGGETGLSAPTLDADIADWDGISGITSTLQMIDGKQYEEGYATMKCMYDSEKIYLALEFPGTYSFNTTDNHFCASIGTMTKVGVAATYYNMGGCPDAIQGCDNGIPDTCMDHLVDIGAHWELATTEQSVEYPIGGGLTSGTGNDEVANKDDEFAVGAFCRFDDNDPQAGNEWAGAWKHTDPTQGADGTYVFELSRLLTTASAISDAQYVAGETYDFGVAFWDPLETENGWTDIGHYITGCGSKWIELELATEASLAENGSLADVNNPGSAAKAGFIGAVTAALALFMHVML